MLACEVLEQSEEPRGAGINLHERLREGTSPFPLLHRAVSVAVGYDVTGTCCTAAVTFPVRQEMIGVLNYTLQY